MIEANLENKILPIPFPTVFLAGGSGDPLDGWAWCETCEPFGVTNRVVHYRAEIAKAFGCGWLGHAGHVCWAIPQDEVREFRIDQGRRFRVAYAVLRGYYAETNVELFIREILAPAMNQAAMKRGRKR